MTVAPTHAFRNYDRTTTVQTITMVFVHGEHVMFIWQFLASALTSVKSNGSAGSRIGRVQDSVLRRDR